MNMSTYPTFIKAVGLYGDVNRPGVSTLPDILQIDKSKFYNQIDISDEEIKRQEKLRSAVMMNHIQEGIDNAKFFEIDDIVKRMLLLTDAPKNPNILKQVKMPFKAVYLDVHIKKEDIPPHFNLDFNQLFGILITPSDWYDNCFAVNYCAEMKDWMVINEVLVPLDPATKKSIHYHDDSWKFFRDFVVSFLLFINHPEIEYYDITRTKKGNLRRIHKNKFPLPSSSRIRLHGKIKKYANSISRYLGTSFDFRFWVRGHWRIHRSEHYKNMRGKVIWLEPYLKGDGVIIDRIYAVKE